MRALALAFFLLAMASAHAAPEVMADPAAEARAHELGAQFRCVVCQSESINDSQADMARDMRLLVREKIRDGWSDQQIVDFMHSRYGDYILMKPPVQANTYVLWALPLVVFAGGFGVVFRYFTPQFSFAAFRKRRVSRQK